MRSHVEETRNGWRKLFLKHVLAKGLAVAFLSMASCFALACSAQGTPVLAPDKGTFRILLGNAEIGTEQFELAPKGDAWIVRGENITRVPGSGEERTTGQLRFLANGTPLSYDWTAQAQKKASGTVEFENGSAKTTTDIGAAKGPHRQDFIFPSPRVGILDNDLYDQYLVLARLYDWNAKGAQNFPVLVPQDLSPGTIRIESLGPKTIAGAPNSDFGSRDPIGLGRFVENDNLQSLNCEAQALKIKESALTRRYTERFN